MTTATGPEAMQRIAALEARMDATGSGIEGVLSEIKGQLVNLETRTKEEITNMKNIISTVLEDMKGKTQEEIQKVRGEAGNEITKQQKALEDIVEKAKQSFQNTETAIEGLRQQAMAAQKAVEEVTEKAKQGFSIQENAIGELRSQAAAAIGTLQQQQQQQPQQQPQTFDPWAAAAAAAGVPAQTQHPDGGSKDNLHWKVDAQRAKSIAKLGMEAASEPQLFKTWQLDASRLVAHDRPRVMRGLKWAEAQQQPINERMEKDMAAEMGIQGDIEGVSAGIYDALLMVISDKVKIPWSRAAGTDKGFELWRWIFREHDSKAPEVVQAMLHHHIKPSRCKDVGELRTAFREWQLKGKELDSMGHEVGDMIRNSALLDLVPKDMADLFLSRSDLRTYQARENHINEQLNYVRGKYVADREAGGKAKTPAAVPMDLNSLMQMAAEQGWGLTPPSSAGKGPGEEGASDKNATNPED